MMHLTSQPSSISSNQTQCQLGHGSCQLTDGAEAEEWAARGCSSSYADRTWNTSLATPMLQAGDRSPTDRTCVRSHDGLLSRDLYRSRSMTYDACDDHMHYRWLAVVANLGCRYYNLTGSTTALTVYDPSHTGSPHSVQYQRPSSPSRIIGCSQLTDSSPLAILRLRKEYILP